MAVGTEGEGGGWGGCGGAASGAAEDVRPRPGNSGVPEQDVTLRH